MAFNRKLRCSKQDFPGDVIFYKKNIPIKLILKILREKEEEYISQKLNELNNLSFNEEKISIKKKAKEIDIPPAILIKKKFSDHIVIGDKIVSHKFLNDLKKEIGNQRDYSIIKKILEICLNPKSVGLYGF